MEVLQFSFRAVGPVILLIGLGLLLRAQEIIREQDIGTLTNLVFRAFLPVMAFNNISDIDFSAEFNAGLLLFVFLGICGLVALLWFGLRPFVRDRELRGAMTHLIYRSNFLILGIALLQNLYDAEGVRIASMLIPVAIIPYNFFAVLVLTAASAEPRQGGAEMAGKLVKDIATNRLIIGCLLGVLLALSGLSLPGVLDSALRSAGAVGTPMALMLLGAQLDFGSLRSNLCLLAVGGLSRLVLVPLVMTSIAVALGFRGVELCCIYMVFGTPSASTAAVMARFYKVKPQLTAQMVVLTHTLCGVTIFLGLSALRLLKLI